ncbi:MAG: hypothetical protein LBC21_03145 [Oscillospiraceae bacterium]|jgi:hypothetical protein|nr:hypothetical protein [Oscillospiraceae bacterium]
MNIKVLNYFGKGDAHGGLKRAVRALCASALALAVVLTAACGEHDAAVPDGAAPAPVAATAPQGAAPADDGAAARAAALAIFEELDAAELEDGQTDFSDGEQAAQYVEKRREIYGRLAALELGWRDEDAQADIRSGVEVMLVYLEGLPAFCAIRGSGTQEAEEMRDDLSAKYASAFGSLAAARRALEAADAPAEPTEPVSPVQ